ncbi:MAG: tetratricopeptide repeat protein, partial [Deltaproteobacteria bacterium]|nr:tetratricopeptide repeat protein [Deltaproteobacteria bacterium]
KEAGEAAVQARAFLLKSVETYKALIDNDAFRNYPKMDTALFYYGYTLQNGRYFKEARAAYDKLLKNYPSSRYVPEAHFAFADYYFEAGQLPDAEARYRKVLEFPRSSVFWHATYKLGWIQLNQQRPQDALETFFKVAQATKGAEEHETLNRAARKDFVRAYAEVGKADKAHVAFQKLDQKRAFDMLEVLADLYLEQGKSEKAIFTYQELMRLAPSHKHVCLWQYDVAHATLSMPRGNGDTAVTKSIVKEVENLTRLYGALKGKKVLPQALAQECRDNAAAMSGELARAYHSEFAKTKNVETLAHADKLYRVNLEVFPDAPDFAQTHYYWAELLWARAETEPNPRLQTMYWEEAANAFADVVKRGKLDRKLLKEAAYATVLGWKNALDVDPNLRKQAVAVDDIEKSYDAVPAPKVIPPKEAKMLAAFRVYIDFIKDPKDDELVRMKFLEANTYRRFNQFDKAIPLFEDIIAKHRDHETSEFAINLLLDTYNRQRNYKAMLALVDKVAGDKKFLDGKQELAELFTRLRIEARRKEAEDLEKRGMASKDFSLLVACGQAYMDIYNSNPEAIENDQVLYNALVCYHEGKSVSAAIIAFNTLQRFYPQSKLMPRAVGRIGKAYGDVALYDKAAEKLEEYGKKYAGEDDAFAAVNDAVLYRKGTGQDDKAIENTRFFVRTFGRAKPEVAANAHFSIASIYEKQGDGDAVVKHLREYVRQFGTKGGASRLVMAHAKIGQALWAQSCPVKQVDGSCVEIRRERAINFRQKRGRAAEQPTQCGPASKIKLTVKRRDERKLKEALAAFALATKEYEKHGGKIGGDERGARYYYAQSKLAQADRDFEDYLATAFPQGLNFDPKNEAIKGKSLKRLDAWVASKMKIGGKATSQYEAVLTVQDPATSIAAAARIGQISQNFSDALFTAEIPKDVRTGEFADEKVEAFCDRMNEIATPLEDRSLEAFRVCLGKSTELGWFSEWSKLCERELGQIRPHEFPTASELRGTPKVATAIAVEPPVARLE